MNSDTITVKKNLPPDSSPLSPPPKSPLLALPRLLSPTLPQIVEDELARTQSNSTPKPEKHEKHTATAERYEQARQPDAPGVARKTNTPKLGHPPKKAEASKSATGLEKPLSLVVKLKYKKRKRQDISRILGLTARPNRAVSEELKQKRQSKLKSSTVKPAEDLDDASDEDVPITKTASKTVSATAFSKKRSNEAIERISEPASKRPRASTIDVAKSRTTLEPPFKSPALTGPSSSQKSLLSTPKKGDALKSTAMRRVDSAENLSRTPQTFTPSFTNTPASAERSRINGLNPDHERLTAEAKRFTEAGTRLKRKMDEAMKSKSGNPNEASDAERKLGLCYGLEALITYMGSWTAQDKIKPSPKAWIDGVRLWQWANPQARKFPILSTLYAQVGALLHDTIVKHLTDGLKARVPEAALKGPDAVKGLLDEFAHYSHAREQLWVFVGQHQSELTELGVREALAPYSGHGATAGFVFGVLDRYVKREKVEWKRSEKDHHA